MCKCTKELYLFNLFRILLYGIVRSIRPLGPLDGLLGGRFILAFFSVLCLLGAKGVYIGYVVYAYTTESISLSTATLMIGLQFVPQTILAIFTTIGYSWSSLRLIPYHSEILLLPAGTYLHTVSYSDYCFYLYYIQFIIVYETLRSIRSSQNYGLSPPCRLTMEQCWTVPPCLCLYGLYGKPVF